MELIQIEPHRKWLRRVLKELGIILPSNRDGGSDNGTKRFKKIDDGDDEKYLKNLDPTKWKEQDHYRVLGLKYRRFLATDEEVKQAYKKIVLLHHPDKKHSQEEGDTETEYFACITKAYQILGDPVKRRSYDSVDEYFDDEIPQINAHSKANFYTVFAPVFARNSRWSNITPVPLLGGDSDTKEKVEKFYDFWYNFDSWREYSYLDEEDKERGQDRIERKWIERQNKAERERRKKEEMKRIRKLVDNAYTCDPRIARFKEEAKTKKLMEKKAKEEARKNKLEEEERRKKEEELARQKKQQEEEEMLKAKREVEKKEKEVIKKQIKRERKQLESFFEENNYFTSDEKERLVYLQELNKIFLTFEHSQLSEFKENIISLTSFEERKNFFKSKIDQINSKNTREQHNVSQTKNDNGNNEESSSTKAWSTEDVQLLIKAVNLFPAGTQNRWEVIAAFVNQHTTSNNKNRKAREVLGKAKDLNKIDMTVKQEMNKISITKLLDSSKSKAKIEEGPSQRYEAPLEENNSLNTEQPWTNQEQQLLEQALKTYPASDPERWSKIANCIPGRSKKECVKRYKELVELVKAKKAAKEAAAQATIKK